jgi:hypothetical protein
MLLIAALAVIWNLLGPRKRPPTEAALMRCFKLCDPAIHLPKLYVMAVHVLFGAVLGFFILRATKLESRLDMAIRPSDVGAVFLHGPPPCKVLTQGFNARF